MSNTDNSIEDWRGEQGSSNRDMRGSVRRFVVQLTREVIWKLAGHLLMDPSKREAVDAEVFSGIGFYARPRANANAEAAVVHSGGAASNPMIVATRDEGLRKEVAGDLDQDETAMFNSAAVVVCKKTGKLHIKTPGGTPTRLPTLADYEALRIAFNQHFHLTAGTGSPSTPAPVPGVIPAPAPTGTQVLETE